MKFSPKVLAAIASVFVSLAGSGFAYRVYAPDGVHESDQMVVKIYDHRACQLTDEGDLHHATVLNKDTGEETRACYGEDKASGLMLFFTEKGGVAMAHRSMF